MFGEAESIQVSKYRITFNLSRILYAEMSRVGIHTHDFLLDFFRFFRKVDAVSERFTHFSFTVSSRKTQTSCIVRQQDFRFYQCLTIYIVETANDFASLFEHRFLVFTHRDSCCAECCNVCCLADGISEETYGNTCFKVTHLDFRFHSRVTLQSGYADKVHIIETKFA